jgi:putative oxidoreductase
MGNLGLGFAPEFWGLMAALGEALGGLLLVLGLLFRPAVLALAFVMFVATINHWVTGMGTPAHSFKNFWFFVGLLAGGPGRYSLDHLIARRRSGSGAVGDPLVTDRPGEQGIPGR